MTTLGEALSRSQIMNRIVSRIEALEDEVGIERGNKADNESRNIHYGEGLNAHIIHMKLLDLFPNDLKGYKHLSGDVEITTNINLQFKSFGVKKIKNLLKLFPNYIITEHLHSNVDSVRNHELCINYEATIQSSNIIVTIIFYDLDVRDQTTLGTLLYALEKDSTEEEGL